MHKELIPITLLQSHYFLTKNFNCSLLLDRISSWRRSSHLYSTRPAILAFWLTYTVPDTRVLSHFRQNFRCCLSLPWLPQLPLRSWSTDPSRSIFSVKLVLNTLFYLYSWFIIPSFQSSLFLFMSLTTYLFIQLGICYLWSLMKTPLKDGKCLTY